MTDQLAIEGRRVRGEMFVGGVDPGKKVTAFALLRCGLTSGPCRVMSLGWLTSPTGASISHALDEWYDTATGYVGKPVLEVHVGIEGQWIPRVEAGLSDAKLARLMGQINATVEVAANRGAWQALADARRWPTNVIHPQQWRAVLGRQPARNRTREALKSYAIQFVKACASEYFGGNPPRRMSDHEAEAILIAQYLAKSIQMQRLREQRERSLQ